MHCFAWNRESVGNTLCDAGQKCFVRYAKLWITGEGGCKEAQEFKGPKFRFGVFVPDYRVNLVIPSEMENFDKFHTELGGVLEAVNTFTGTKITLNEKEGETNMGIAWDEMLNEERTEGRAEGRAEGQRELIKRMLAKHKTPQEIADLCDYDIKEIEAVEKEMCTLA